MNKTKQLILVLLVNIIGLKLAVALAASVDLAMCPKLESGF